MYGLKSDALSPGYEEIEHSQGHERDPDVEGNSHRSIFLEDFLQLLGLVWFSSLWLRLPRERRCRWGSRRGLLEFLFEKRAQLSGGGRAQSEMRGAERGSGFNSWARFPHRVRNRETFPVRSSKNSLKLQNGPAPKMASLRI